MFFFHKVLSIGFFEMIPYSLYTNLIRIGLLPVADGLVPLSTILAGDERRALSTSSVP